MMVIRFVPNKITQWCIRDRNLWDRDLVKISRRDRDFIKNSETKTRDLKFEAETSKFVHFAEIFQKNVVITSDHGGLQGGRAFPPLRFN